jgi:hypothetical protein
MVKKPKSSPGTARSISAVGQSGKAGQSYKMAWDWGLLSDGELARPGATLMNLILAASYDRRLTMRQVAEMLGVSYPYFFGLRNGKSDISKLGDEHIERAAKFLAMPKLAAMLAAGQLKYEDFYSEPAKLRDSVQPSLRFIQSDPEYAAYLPASIVKADPAIQLCVVMLYERATGRTLIPGRVPTEEIVRRHRSLVQS